MDPLRFFDAHNHLQSAALDAVREGYLEAMQSMDIGGCVVNGTEEADWGLVSSLCQSHPNLVPNFGLHPWDAGNRSGDWLQQLRKMLLLHPAAGVGEIGLDAWMLNHAKLDDPRLTGLRRAPLEEQLEVFQTQFALASEFNRPASIHCTEAWGLLQKSLEECKSPHSGFLLHAYSGPKELVPFFVERGAFFSFNGSYLNPKRRSLQDTFRDIPKDRLLIETDAPAMLPPEPWRTHIGHGSRENHPSNIIGIYAGLSAILDIEEETLVLICAENYQRLFRGLHQ